jgi:small-conductance mechanosensitive channel
MIYQLIATAAVLLVGVVLRGVMSSFVNRRVKGGAVKPQSAFLARKMATVFLFIVVVYVVAFIWGVGIRTIWVSLASIITLVTIGFFAVWCILSNIVAGFILLISRPFDIGDEIILLPENIQGKVTNITVLFLILEESDGSTVTVPNNFIFQKIVRKSGKRGAQ